MSKSSKTQTILKDKSPKLNTEGECLPCKAAKEQVKEVKEPECLPCQAKNNTLWRVYVHHNNFFTDPEKAGNSYKVVGDALTQFAGFSASHVQSIFTSMVLLPSEWHLIYSGNEQSAAQIHDALASAGITPRIEATLKTF